MNKPFHLLGRNPFRSSYQTVGPHPLERARPILASRSNSRPASVRNIGHPLKKFVTLEGSPYQLELPTVRRYLGMGQNQATTRPQVLVLPGFHLGFPPFLTHTHLAMVQQQWYHFVVSAPPSLVYSGDWDVHWGYGVLTHTHFYPRQVQQLLCALDYELHVPCLASWIEVVCKRPGLSFRCVQNIRRLGALKEARSYA